jgi:polyisoprenoid-binding protein YceI
MLHRFTTLSVVLLGLILLLAACGGTPEPPPTPAPTPTPIVEEAAATNDGGIRTYQVVPGESTASYLVDEEFFAGAFDKLGIKAGLVDVIGSTQEIEGQFQIDWDDLASPLGENRFTVNLTSLATDQSRRDNWIQKNGPQFGQYPLAEFVGASVEGSPDTYNEGDEVQFKFNGNLTIRETTQPVTFDVTAKLEGDTIMGVASTRLLMSDFGIDPPNFANTLAVEDEFGIEINFVAKEQ